MLSGGLLSASRLMLQLQVPALPAAQSSPQPAGGESGQRWATCGACSALQTQVGTSPPCGPWFARRACSATPVELGFVGSWGRGFRAWEPQQEVLGSPGLLDGPELRLVALPASGCPPHTPPRCGRGDALRRALPCPALPAAQMCPELREN